MRKIISNRLTTASLAGCDLPKELQTHREDRRRTARQIEYTKMDREFDGVSNRLTFSKCLTTASSAGCERPKQLQTHREDKRRTARQIENTKMDGDFDGVSNRLTFLKCLTPEDFSLTPSPVLDTGAGVRVMPPPPQSHGARPIAEMQQNATLCNKKRTFT